MSSWVGKVGSTRPVGGQEGHNNAICRREPGGNAALKASSPAHCSNGKVRSGLGLVFVHGYVFCTNQLGTWSAQAVGCSCRWKEPVGRGLGRWETLVVIHRYSIC